jgi:hypothetical protein
MTIKPFHDRLVTLSGVPTLTALFGVGAGFGNVGLVQTTPEPSTFLFAGSALLLLFKYRRISQHAHIEE